MKFSLVTREKVESLFLDLPQISSYVLVSSPESKFYLGLSGGLFPIFVVGIVDDDKITYISDENYKEELNSFITEK